MTLHLLLIFFRILPPTSYWWELFCFIWCFQLLKAKILGKSQHGKGTFQYVALVQSNMTQEPSAGKSPTIFFFFCLTSPTPPSTFLIVLKFLKAWEELLTKGAMSIRNDAKERNPVFLHVIKSKISFYRLLRYEVLWGGHNKGQLLEGLCLHWQPPSWRLTVRKVEVARHMSFFSKCIYIISL